jgi:hypothetical protein
VLFALGCGSSIESGWSHLPTPADADQRAVLQALAGDAATIGQVESRAALPAERLGAALRALEISGHVERKRGLWWPR